MLIQWEDDRCYGMYRKKSKNLKERIWTIFKQKTANELPKQTLYNHELKTYLN